MIIAVDGPSAAGKGTIARAIAAAMGYHFLDTGSLYRIVALMMLRQGKDLDDAEAAAKIAATIDPSAFDDNDLRGEEVAAAASRVSVFPEVRKNLLGFQRDFARRQPGAVLDGRDIGTVVCPDADVKLFITASPEVRARRRFQELLERGGDPAFETVLADVKARDARDAGRAHSPLKPAADAIVIDTSAIGRDEAIAAAIEHVRGKIR